MVATAGGLLHVVGDDDHGVVALQFHNQFFNFCGGNGVECRAGFVQQQDFGFDGDAACDAQALLLTTREAGAALVQFVFDFVPQGRFAQGPLYALFHIGTPELFKKFHAKGNVVKDRHRKRRGLLEHHAHFGTQQRHILFAGEQVIAIEQHLPFGALIGVQLKHAVEDAQKRGFAATGGADEGGDPVLGNLQIDGFECVEFAVIKVEVFDRNLGFGGG